MLNRQRPTLLTFEDEEEFNQAKTYLLTKGIHIQQAGTNQFRYIYSKKKFTIKHFVLLIISLVH
jgi:hypothetical protein